MSLRTLLSILLSLALAAGLAAQFPQGYRQRREARPIYNGLPRHDGVPDRGFTFCLLAYTRVRMEDGGLGWSTDYPLAGANFMTRLSELTPTTISRWPDGEAGHAVVRATDHELFECPFLFASDVGTMGLDPTEIERLREYLFKGGFLWADDFWGDRAWAHWVDQIERVLPGYPIVELGPDHPMFHALYRVERVPQVPSIQAWNRSGRRSTSERGAESATPHVRAIFDENGRMLVLMSHNTDIADGWEREAADNEFFYTFSPESYAIGVNIAVWSMTH